MTPKLSKRTRRRAPAWTRLSLDDLLDVRLCDLELTIEGTALEDRIEELYASLKARGLRFRPHVWLSTDWFSPDGNTGFAVPFYLAHPRLARLERREMLEVEGGTRDWCMKLLRHETAHALDNAYRLRRKKRWREIFGPASTPYRDSYVAAPDNKNFVINLDYWYSQSHPAEDFAETFAVWLRPKTKWKSYYAGWPALKKLEFVDELMGELAKTAPAVRSSAKPEAIHRQKQTLREYYDEKKERYREDAPHPFDDQLRSVFRRQPRGESAATFLRRHRVRLRRRVSNVTTQHPYVIDQVLNEMIHRTQLLGLKRKKPDGETFLDVCILLTATTIHFVHGGHPEYRR